MKRIKKYFLIIFFAMKKMWLPWSKDKWTIPNTSSSLARQRDIKNAREKIYIATYADVMLVRCWIWNKINPFYLSNKKDWVANILPDSHMWFWKGNEFGSVIRFREQMQCWIVSDPESALTGISIPFVFFRFKRKKNLLVNKN